MGALGDLGWYTARMTLFVMNYVMPKSLRATMLSELKRDDSPAPVPTEISAELLFDGGISATFYNSFLTQHQQWVNVSGSKGHLQIDDFVLPFAGSDREIRVSNAEFVANGCQFHMHPGTTVHTIEEPANNHPDAQETKLFRTFADLALAGTPDPFWPEASLKTQRILDAVLHSARNGGEAVTF
jgi:predicted dehydrogenase